MSAVPAGGWIGRVKAAVVGVGRAPLCRDHHVVVRLVPEVVPERYRLVPGRPRACTGERWRHVAGLCRDAASPLLPPFAAAIISVSAETSFSAIGTLFTFIATYGNMQLVSSLVATILTFQFKRFAVEKDESAAVLSVLIAHRGDHNLAGSQAVWGVRTRNIQSRHLLRLHRLPGQTRSGKVKSGQIRSGQVGLGLFASSQVGSSQDGLGPVQCWIFGYFMVLWGTNKIYSLKKYWYVYSL